MSGIIILIALESSFSFGIIGKSLENISTLRHKGGKTGHKV